MSRYTESDAIRSVERNITFKRILYDKLKYGLVCMRPGNGTLKNTVSSWQGQRRRRQNRQTLTWPEQVMTEYGYVHHDEPNIKEDETKYDRIFVTRVSRVITVLKWDIYKLITAKDS